MATDTTINNIIINKLTTSKYNELKQGGQVSDTELYMITDDEVDVQELQEETISLRNDLNNGTLSITGTGETVTLNNTVEARLKQLQVGGNSIQDGTPVPSVPVDIDNVTGNVNITVQNSDNTASQVFTFPLGTDKLREGDYLADDGIHHVKNQVVFDGSNDEEWAREGDNRYILVSDAVGNNSESLSNYFNYTTTGESVSGNFKFGTSNKNLIFFKMAVDFGTAEAWREWLSTHNVTVEYSLTTPVVIPYTAEQQEVYNNIKKAMSYDAITHVSSINEVSPIFNVIAIGNINNTLGDIETLLEGV